MLQDIKQGLQTLKEWSKINWHLLLLRQQSPKRSRRHQEDWCLQQIIKTLLLHKKDSWRIKLITTGLRLWDRLKEEPMTTNQIRLLRGELRSTRMSQVFINRIIKDFSKLSTHQQSLRETDLIIKDSLWTSLKQDNSKMKGRVRLIPQLP